MRIVTTLDLSRVDEYISAGLKDRFWYQRTEEVFTELYGKHRVKLIADLFAATSINTSLKSNITLFRRALYEIDRGLPVSNYLPNIQKQLHRIRAGQELSGQKIRAFAAAMSGDVNAVVVDVWLLRAFNMEGRYFRKHSNTIRSAGATKKQFTLIESWVRAEAVRRDLQPRELSAILWAGTRITQGGDRETSYENILRLKEYNMFNNPTPTLHAND